MTDYKSIMLAEIVERQLFYKEIVKEEIDKIRARYLKKKRRYLPDRNDDIADVRLTYKQIIQDEIREIKESYKSLIKGE